MRPASFLRTLGAESGGVPFLVKALLASARGGGARRPVRIPRA